MIPGFDMTEYEIWECLLNRPEYVYKIQKGNELIYIGSTMQPEHRSSSHECRVDGFSFCCAEVPRGINAAEVEKAAIAKYTPILNLAIHKCDAELIEYYESLEFKELCKYKSTGAKARKYMS